MSMVAAGPPVPCSTSTGWPDGSPTVVYEFRTNVIFSRRG